MMLNEIKAEIIESIGNRTFLRNFSLSLIIAIASLLVLADLQSQSTKAVQHSSITTISRWRLIVRD